MCCNVGLPSLHIQAELIDMTAATSINDQAALLKRTRLIHNTQHSNCDYICKADDTAHQPRKFGLVGSRHLHRSSHIYWSAHKCQR